MVEEEDFIDILSSPTSSFNCDNIDLILFDSNDCSKVKDNDFELPRSKKLKASGDECNVLDKILCTFKDPIHVLKDPIRLPCSSRYICKECMWMSNPNDKTFKCRFCKKKHLKRKIMTANATNKIDNYVKNNLNLIIDKFLSQIRVRIDEINGKNFGNLF
jgi:hypothetical protein